MSAICNQCIGTSDYRRGPRANVCLIVSPLFCLHGEFGSPCLGFIAFDPVYVCTHYNNSPREGSPVADVDQLGCEGSQTAAAPTPDIRTPETRGGHDSMTSCSGRTPHYPPDNGWVVMVCGGRGSQWSHNYTDTDTAVALGKMVLYMELQNPLSGTKLKPKFRKIIVLRDWHASGWKGHHWKNF